MEVLIFWDRGAPSGIGRRFEDRIGELFPFGISLSDNPVLPSGFSQPRGQYDAHAILDSMDTYRRRNGIESPALLVVGDDLYHYNSPHVFGLARPKTGSAVISTARLSNGFYDRHEDDDELIDRLVKEAGHEIGHLFNLQHCQDPACIMYNPAGLDDLSRKRRAFCPSCRALLSDQIDPIQLLS